MLSMKFLVVVSAVLALASASCPNKCSGHGACGANDVCLCKQNWMGGDCSLRVCPYTRAWVDEPKVTDGGHYYAECGNKGSCDRSTGICVCDAGYSGSGCRRQACPSDCSGHGTCEFIEDMIATTSTDVTYTLWDQEKTMGCKCDPGFEGHDCSSKICPKGDDPVTSYDQNNMVQYIHYKPDTSGTPSTYASIYLSYVDPYGATWTTSKINVVDAAVDTTYSNSAFCTNVQEALQKVPNLALKGLETTPITGAFGSVTRTKDAVTDGAASVTTITPATSEEYACQIIFPAAAGTTGLQNIISCHSGPHETYGSQPLVDNAIEDTCTTGEFIAGSDTSPVHKLTELATCSNRGLCDGSVGECQCFAGHRGLACETQEALV